MAMSKIKKGDTVQAIAGKDKGKQGKVISVDKKKGKVLVEGINMIAKHEKPSASNQDGGIVHKEAPFDISNVMYVHKGKVTRVGFKVSEETVGDKKVKKKVRIAKSTGETID